MVVLADSWVRGRVARVSGLGFVIRAVASVALAGILLVAHPAFAGTSTGAVSRVRYYTASGSQYPQLILQVGGYGTNYYAQVSSPGCSIPANTIDTLKIWQSLATASILSSRTAVIDYTTCGGYNYITNVEIQ